MGKFLLWETFSTTQETNQPTQFYRKKTRIWIYLKASFRIETLRLHKRDMRTIS